MSLDTIIGQRTFNFSAGPATLPLSVLKKCQEELLCLPGAGASILEISHRSKQFVEIVESTKKNLIELLSIPDDYEVIFLQGGSRLQFSMIPMNLLKGSGLTADYITTGSWGKKASAEAVKEGSTNIAWDGAGNNYSTLPTNEELKLSENAAYVYFTSNETIQGVQFPAEPLVGDAPLICDTSSDFLHRPIPVSRYGLIYACAQKNAGPAGVTVVIIRKDLLERCDDGLPGYCNYQEHVKNDSMYNTPPTFAIYLMNCVFEWLADEVGGLQKMHERNREKAQLLYDAIDASEGFYQGHAANDCRSLMNVTFRLPNDDLQNRFITQAKDANLDSLKGHRSVGGIRASIYNAMPLEGVQALRDYMVTFKNENA